MHRLPHYPYQSAAQRIWMRVRVIGLKPSTFSLTVGLRIGEVLGLKWSDIDLYTGALRVDRQLQWYTGKGLVFSEPEHGSRRIVDLPQRTSPQKPSQAAGREEGGSVGRKPADAHRASAVAQAIRRRLRTWQMRQNRG
jgi:integrase